MPTTITKTIGSGRDYATIDAWVAGAASTYPSGLVAADVIWRGVLYKEGGGTNNEWQITTGTTAYTLTCDSTRYYLLEAASGQSFTDNGNKLTNSLRYNNANGVAISVSGAYVFLFEVTNALALLKVRGIQIKNAVRRVGIGTGTLIFENCILFGDGVTGDTKIFDTTGSATNSLIYMNAAGSIVSSTSWGSNYLKNCILIGSGSANYAFFLGNYSGGNVIKNCAIFGFTSGIVSNTARIDTTNSTYNATDLASFGWSATGNLVSKTFANQFENTGGGTEDFRVKAGADLIGAGVRDQTYTNDLDIVLQGRSITTPTIGAWEYLATPNPPTGVTAGSVTAFAVTASWTDVSLDETGFKVQYAPSPYSSWTAFSGSPTAANATTLASGNVLTPGTSYKIRVASTNANGDSAYVESGVFTATPLTFLRPIADTSNGAWTASSGSDRYAMIDESATNDSDYITVSSASTYKTRMTTVSDPGVNTDHSVVVRAKGDGSSQLTIALVQGHPSETAIASMTVTPTVSYADYTLTVTSGQAASITDYSLLFLKLTSL